jgi:two-component system alkaline phosphatase synthesis response regulator PhoP
VTEVDEKCRQILVVDDEDDVRILMKFILEPLGYLVHTAGDGEEALELLREERVAVVLVDLLMPGMGGRKFLERIADLPEEGRPVTMVNSARRLEEIRGEVEGLGVFDIVTKPFDIVEIEKRIALACSEKLRRLGC